MPSSTRLSRTSILLATGCTAAMYIESLNPHTLHTLTLLITSFNRLCVCSFVHSFYAFLSLGGIIGLFVALVQGLAQMGSGGGERSFTCFAGRGLRASFSIPRPIIFQDIIFHMNTAKEGLLIFSDTRTHTTNTTPNKMADTTIPKAPWMEGEGMNVDSF